MVGKVFPEWLFTQRLLMKSLVGPTAIEGSFGSVAIVSLLSDDLSMQRISLVRQFA
jgi:hypothetical protein